MGLVVLDGDFTSGAGDKDVVRIMTSSAGAAVTAVAAETVLPFATEQQ